MGGISQTGWRLAARDRGQSQMLGMMLLIGIAVVLFTAAGAFLFAEIGGSEESPSANLDIQVEATNVTIDHEGGATLDPGEVTVLLSDGDTERPLQLDEAFDETDGNEESFAPGDSWRAEELSPAVPDEGQLIIVHEGETDTTLLDRPYST